MTEGRSQTESDTNVRSQTRDILGQSGKRGGSISKCQASYLIIWFLDV